MVKAIYSEETMDKNLSTLIRAVRHHCIRNNMLDHVRFERPICAPVPVYYTYTLGNYKGIFMVPTIDDYLFEAVYNRERDEVYVIAYAKSSKNTYDNVGLPIQE